MISSINIRKKFTPFIFIHLIKFGVDNARVCQRVFMNFKLTDGQVACRLYSVDMLIAQSTRLRPAFGEPSRLLGVN